MSDKNIFKKMTVLLLAVALLVPGFTPSFANPANQSGHPDPAERGSITINIRKVDEIVPGGITPPVTSGVPIENVPVRIERVTLNTGVAAPTQEQLQDPAWIAANTSIVAGTNIENLTNANGVVVFNNLPQGIWRVSQLNIHEGVTNPIPEGDRFTPFLVGIPTYRRLLPGDTGYVPGEVQYFYDLHPVVWPKIEREGLKNGSKEGIAYFDNIITWEFGIGIPESIGTAREFYLLDRLDERLEFITGSVTGRFTPHPSSTSTGVLQPSHFTTTVHDVNGDDVVRIALTPAGIAHIAAEGDLAAGRLYFTMDTRLHIGDDEDLGEIRNDAVWRYNPETPWGHCPEDDPNYPDCDYDEDLLVCDYDDPGCYGITATVRTLALNILKLSVADRQPLQGAAFSIYRQLPTDLPAGDRPANAVQTNTGVWVVPLRRANGDAMSGVTDANGILQFDGINSIGAGSYGTQFWLRETAAPTGFRVINEWMQVSVTPANTGYRTPAPEYRVFANGLTDIVYVNVYNERQGAWVLPETGAIGTIILTVAGIGLLVGALVLFVSKKKEDDVT